MISCIYLLIVSFAVSVSSQWIDYPATGFATMSHYGGLSNTSIAACGCNPATANYATAALSQMVRIHLFLWVNSFSDVFLGIWKLAGLWLGMREMLQSDITEYFHF